MDIGVYTFMRAYTPGLVEEFSGIKLKIKLCNLSWKTFYLLICLKQTLPKAAI